ncbi:MAG: hypothetical protein WBM90_02215 [Acidimicrobiia bacterium]
MDEDTVLDELNRQLASVRDQLLAVAPDDFPEKFRLKSEQDRLRSLSRRYARDWDERRPKEVLAAELQTRRSALDALTRQMVTAGDGVNVNIAMKKAGGVTELTQRIAHLEMVLSKLGDAP